MKRVSLRVLAALAATALVAPTAWAQGAPKSDHVMVKPGDLKWAAVPSLPPGAQGALIEGPMNEAVPFTLRLKFPPNYQVPPHSHTAIEHVTVVSGEFNLGMGDKFDESKTMALPAGSMAIMQPGTQHFATTKVETIVQVHGIGPWVVNYVNPADDPRKK